jgi:hypothetical protein
MAEPDDVGNIVWEDEALGLAGSSYDKAIASTTREREWVISAWAPTHLAVLLAKWFWKDDKPDVGAKKVWLDTCRYLYLPRLATEDVFASTVRDGIKRREWFGYAAGAKDGGYSGHRVRQLRHHLHRRQLAAHPPRHGPRSSGEADGW